MIIMDECTVKDSFPLSCIDMVYGISCAMSSAWYISTFAMLMTISIAWFFFTQWFYRSDKSSKASHRMDLFVYFKCWNLENINVLKMPECFWVRKETEHLSVIMDNGTFRLAPHTFAALRNWFSPKTQKHIKSFVQFFLMVILFTVTLIMQRH
jgi:hypothetical protein